MTPEELRQIAVDRATMAARLVYLICLPAIEDQEQRIVETIDNAAHVMQRAMQELNQLRRLRGVA